MDSFDGAENLQTHSGGHENRSSQDSGGGGRLEHGGVSHVVDRLLAPQAFSRPPLLTW